jgi:hypothetical protein
MTRIEWEEMWHDWLRGVSLIALCAVLAGIYFLKLFSEPVFGMVLSVTAVGLSLTAVILNCASSTVHLVVRVSGAAVAVACAAGFLVQSAQVLFPGQPEAQVQLSHLQPQGTLEVPGSAGLGSFLVVRGRPGASPSGQDSHVKGSIRLDVGDTGRQVPVALFRGSPGGGGGNSKGPSISAREADMWYMGNLPSGTARVELRDLRPEDALPLTVSLHVPMISPSRVEFALWGLVGLALILSIPLLRKGRFPAVVPFSAAIGVVGELVLNGLPPDRPVLPLVGMLLGGILGGALAGYLATRLLGRLTGGGQEIGARPRRK